MHTCIHTFIPIHIHINFYTYIHFFKYTYIHTYIHAYIHIYIGAMDCAAYLPKDDWGLILKNMNLNEIDIRDSRYDCVIHLTTAANGAEEFYTVYIHTYIHIYIHTYIHTCIHTYIHTYTHP